MPAQPEPSPPDVIAGADRTRRLDVLFVNAPLCDYAQRPRVNDFTLPVLGMGYLATYAAAQGFNVGVLDAEAHGLGIAATIELINTVSPRWTGFNLLAPTYEISARIAAQLDPSIKIMLGGHQRRSTTSAPNSSRSPVSSTPARQPPHDRHRVSSAASKPRGPQHRASVPDR